MRRIAMLMMVPLLATAGCACDKSHCGYYAGFLKPPTIDASNPMIIQSTSPWIGAQPLGSMSGPINGGGFQVQPGAVLQPSAAVVPVPLAAPCGTPPAAPPQVPAAQRLSCEEWCELMREAQRRQLLPMPQREGKPKEE